MLGGHKCGICLDTRSEHLAPHKSAHEDWCTLTSCGHVYHLSCVEQWHRAAHEQGCPNRCPSRNVKRQKRAGSNLTEALPYLRLFLDSPAAAGSSSSSSDPVGPEEEVRLRGRMRRGLGGRGIVTGQKGGKGKGKGKARAVPDDENEDNESQDVADYEGCSSSDGEKGEGGRQDEITRLRRQRAEALTTVRAQRTRIAQLEARVRELAPDTAPAEEVMARTSGPAPPSPQPADATETESRHFSARPGPSRGERPGLTYGNVAESDDYGGRDDDEERSFDGAGGVSPPPGADGTFASTAGDASELDVAIRPTRKTLRANDPQTVAALAAQLRALQTRFDALSEEHEGLQTRAHELVRLRDEVRTTYHEAKIKWEEELRRLREQLGKSGASGAETIRRLEREMEDKDRVIFRLKAEQEGHQLRAEVTCRQAQDAAAQARQEALAAQTEAQRQIATAKENEAAEAALRRRIEQANELALRRNKKLKSKLRQVQLKRGILATESDGEEGPAPPEASTSTSTSSAPLTKRCRVSRSPEWAQPLAFRVHDHSRLVGKSIEGADNAADTEANQNSPYPDGASTRSETSGTCDDRPAEKENRPPPGAPDSDSDIEIVESSFFARAAGSTVSSTSGSRAFVTNALATNAAKARSDADISKSLGRSAFGRTTLGSGSSRPSNGWGPPQKEALSHLPSDKYLPDFTSGVAIPVGAPKHRVKRK